MQSSVIPESFSSNKSILIDYRTEEFWEWIQKEIKTEVNKQVKESFDDLFRDVPKTKNSKGWREKVEEAFRSIPKMEISKRWKKKSIDNNEQSSMEPVSENEGISAIEESIEPVTYKDAFEKLGGVTVIEKFQKLSEDLKGKLVNKIIDKEIKRILPPGNEWAAFSTILVNQPYVSNLDELYDLAKKVKAPFEKAVKNLAHQTASRAIIAPLKRRERACNKAHYKYKDYQGNGIGYYRITDILRATLEFITIEEMYTGLDIIFKSRSVKIKEFNDRYQNPLHGDYRDIQLIMEIDGFMCELQVTTRIMLQAKETLGHRNYQVFRELKKAISDGDLSQVEASLSFGREQLGSSLRRYFVSDKNYRLLAHVAARLGNAEILACLLEEGADADAQDEDGETPLHHAISNGNERCVWLLLNRFKARTDLKNRNNESALLKGYLMLYGGRPEPYRRAMLTLLQMVSIEELKDAVSRKDEIVSSRLMNSRSLVDHTIDGNIDNMRELLKDYSDPNSSRDGMTALQMAIQTGNHEAVKLLLDFNASLGELNGKLLVQEALDRGYIEIAKTLGYYNASFEGTRWSILVDYAENGNIKEMRKLLKANIDPNSSRNGMPALQAAVAKNQQRAVELLLKYKASTIEKGDGIPMVEHALNNGNMSLVSLLIDAGANCQNVSPKQRTIPCDLDEFDKYWGIAQYKAKLFCAPCDASSVLIIDGELEECRTLELGDDGYNKYCGITRCGRKMYCAPSDASSVLIIDGDLESLRTIECGVIGEGKWSGIASNGKKIFCAPFNASSVLVIDGELEQIRIIECGVKGRHKWSGIAAYGRKMFCCPSDAQSILVIDSETEIVTTIPLDHLHGFTGICKWAGIVCYGNKLFCSPFNASSILVINGDTEVAYTIPCDIMGNQKWMGIERFGSRLICSPRDASSLLIIDPCSEEVTSRKLCSNYSEERKWSGITSYGTKIFCCPLRSKEILILEDQAMKLELECIMKKNETNKEKKLLESSFLVDCAQNGMLKQMEDLLRLGVDPNSKRDEVTSLFAAVRENDLTIVKSLLIFGVSISERWNDKTIVDEAISLKHVKVANMLSDVGAKSNILFDCAAQGNVDQIEELLTTYGTKSIIREELSSSLRMAIRSGHQMVVKKLIDYDVLFNNGNYDDGVPIILEALDHGHCDIARFLYEYGINNSSSTNMPLAKRTLSCGIHGSWKWWGIARYKTKLFCAPYNSSSILIIDAEVEKVHSIECGVDGDCKWQGIARLGNKMFCAPCDASSVLVIDAELEQVRTINCGVVGNKKWCGIVGYGTKLYCAPSQASSILVIDGEKEEVYTIPCGDTTEGYCKWSGIAANQNKLYCSPYNASTILVIDCLTENIHHILLEDVEGEYKWRDIVSYGKHLYCSPFNASSIMRIDGVTEEIKLIPCDIDGAGKWSGIEKIGTKLVCTPWNASSILILDGETEKITSRQCSNDNRKWSGITSCGNKLFGSPYSAENFLILEDHTLLFERD